MTLGRIALDIVMAGVVLSLITIVAVFLTAGVTALAMMARATRDRHGHRHSLEHLSNGCAVDDLAEIDDTLDRIAAQEYGGLHTTSVW